MATYETIGATGEFIAKSGSETSGIIHLNPTPLAMGSGEAIVFSKSFSGNPTTGMVLIELPPTYNTTNGMVNITITGYNNQQEVNGGGAWTLNIGGNTVGTSTATWTNYNATYIGPAAFSAPQNIQFLAKGSGANSAFAFSLGAIASAWYTQSLQIRVQAGYGTHDSTLQNPWAVTTGVIDAVPTGWTSIAQIIAKRSVVSTGDTITGQLNLAGNRILNVGSGVLGTDAVNKTQLDTKSTVRRMEYIDNNQLAGGSTRSYGPFARLDSSDFVINIINISTVPYFGYSVSYLSPTTFSFSIYNMSGSIVTPGTFNYFMSKTG
jgi:hypothetical protein